ncbi:MAG: FAD-binding protein [Bacteroidales bacterium]|nr:FAD-binding protein [Bacteroidales bacterium]
MVEHIATIQNIKIKVVSLNTVIIGSGAAGLNAADRLLSFGQPDIAIITEGLKEGTSRNTGSDKQTYYKLNLFGDQEDSIEEVAKNLFQGGGMDGDIALVEAALSPWCFLHLVDIGVPFPHNQYGEFIGYKTDYDPRQRATSAGALTSRLMTEQLERQIISKGIKIYDGYQVITLLTDIKKTRVIGCMALNLEELSNPDQRLVLFNCQNIVYAVGGPAGIYLNSVYPENQNGATGIALEAGAMGKNLTESQYGIASTKFRWNLSGSYQQVLPRYVSTDQKGRDEIEFLDPYFGSTGKMLDAIFLKGYQWPFDPGKIENDGSSLIDLLVYYEMVVKGRRVWLDYQHNPSKAEKEAGKIDFSLLSKETFLYLKKSGALLGNPIGRLRIMNQPAIDLYHDHGIDLSKEYLEIAVCAQHNNGGLHGNIWWESNLSHFFPVGEVNGSHGVHRPGGSALNAGQVGSLRAAQFIAHRYDEEPLTQDDFVLQSKEQVVAKINTIQKLLTNLNKKSNTITFRDKARKMMSKYGAHIRSLKGIEEALKEIRQHLECFPENNTINSAQDLGVVFKNYDLLITQFCYLRAIKNYLENGGQSRGSYLVYNKNGQLPQLNLPDMFRFQLDNGKLDNCIQRIHYHEGKCYFYWDKVKPIPKRKDWFECVWKDYREDRVIKEDKFPVSFQYQDKLNSVH